MARARSRVVDYCVYLLVRLVICVLQMFPVETVLRLASPLAWLFRRIDRRHGAVAADNLRHAFPHLSEEEIDRLVDACYHHFCKMILEIVFLPRLFRLATLGRYFNYRNPGDFDRVHSWWNRPAGQPMLLLTAHLGNWEVMSFAMGMAGFRASVIARRLDNPYLDQFLRQFRRRTGQEILSKNDDYGKIREALDEGQVLGMLGDQDAGARGVFVDFFGRPASTYKAIGLLALEYQMPIVVVAAVRIGDPICYRLLVPDIIDTREYLGRPDAVHAITQRYTAALEAMIREFPEQYFWLHRRWKHQPKVRENRRAA